MPTSNLFNSAQSPSSARPGTSRSNLKIWLGSAVAMVVLVLLAMRYVDFPLATWLHDTGIDAWRGLTKLMNLPVWMAPLGMLYMLYHVMLPKPRHTFHHHNWFVISATMTVALSVKNILKIAFGRTWPKDIAPGDGDLVLPIGKGLSYLHDGFHAFQPFSGLKAFTAFPSGTTITVVSVAIPIAFCYPKARWPIAILAAATVIALLQTNTHFISDVIAGLWVAAVIGVASLDYLVLPVRGAAKQPKPTGR